MALVLAFWPDSDPPHDGAMLPSFPPVSPDNPMIVFQSWLEANPIGAGYHQFELLRDEDLWDPDEADDLLDEHSEALERYHRLLETDHLTWRWREGEAVASYLVTHSYIDDLMNTAKLSLVKARRQTESGFCLPRQV